MRKIIILIFLSGTTTHYFHVGVELWFLVLKRHWSYIYSGTYSHWHQKMSCRCLASPKNRHFLMLAIIIHNVQSTLDINPIFSAGTRTELLNITFHKKTEFFRPSKCEKKGSDIFFSNKTTTTYLLHNGVSHDASH